MPAPSIVLLTDFGTSDGYVAEMKGVLLSMAPMIPVIDASHDIPAQDVDYGRITLARYWRRYPAGTVHLCVVDPGVGGRRAALAVASSGQFFVGPDNGLLSPALFALDAEVVSLPIPAHSSSTFQGRDVFAPTAARIALGESIHSLGEIFRTATMLRTPVPRKQSDGVIAGQVITIDRFGNAITNLIPRSGYRVVVAGMDLPIVKSYSDVPFGSVVAVTSSSGLVEVAITNGNAATSLGLQRGTEVLLVSDV